MGKKIKTGKARKDRFYHLAKETGYRSRAAFKLIQLNKKFQFLNKSRVVIDLCAAPGGWMQVVAENTPVSSLIVGVDLVPIRPVSRCIALQEDITTSKCRQALKKELQTWQADCVLNDGAPNVGKNWDHDAYNQSELTLHALKLATEFLRKGGWFVTKLFRSKDYFALDWVFRQLFKKVWATKPQASRNESAEIFVICEHYLAPDKLDPKFLDPKHVFKEVSDEPVRAINLMHPEKKQRHREGYAEGDYTLFHVLKASEFLSCENFLDKLATSSMVELDDEAITSNPATTAELQECLKDIKVLGRKEIKAVLAWRKAVLKDIQKAEKEKQEAAAARLAETEGAGKEEEEVSDHDEEEKELLERLKKAHDEDRMTAKRKSRKERKLKAKKQHRRDLKMDIPGDRLDYGDDVGIFSLAKIRSKQALDTVQEGDITFMDKDYMDDSDKDADMVLKRRKLLEAYDKSSKNYELGSEFPSDEEGLEEPTLLEFEDGNVANSDDEDDVEEEDNNPLVVDMETKDSKMKSRTMSWFSKDVFDGLEKGEDEDAELEAMVADYEQRGGAVLGKQKGEKTPQEEDDDSRRKEKRKKKDNEEEVVADENDDKDDGSEAKESIDSSDDDEDDDDTDSDDEDSSSDDDSGVSSGDETIKEKSKKGSTKTSSGTGDFEVVPVDKEALKLDPEGLAMGTAMVQSKKRKRDMIDGGYHRYMRGEEEDGPDWFVKDEKKHYQKQMPVTKEEVQEYIAKQRALDARPIKKLAEAKARKKKKMVRRLEKARKKADAISDTVDVSEKEKLLQIKNIYKRAGLLGQKKPEVTYVVAKKGVGKRVHRPKGVAGRFKVVDPRMKKDMRSEKAASRKERKGGKGRKTANTSKAKKQQKRVRK